MVRQPCAKDLSHLLTHCLHHPFVCMVLCKLWPGCYCSAIGAHITTKSAVISLSLISFSLKKQTLMSTWLVMGSETSSDIEVIKIFHKLGMKLEKKSDFGSWFDCCGPGFCLRTQLMTVNAEEFSGLRPVMEPAEIDSYPWDLGDQLPNQSFVGFNLNKICW